jgi:hypothetical protein
MSKRQDRFVVLRHQVGPHLERTRELHFDWMFEVEGELRTFCTAPIDSFGESFEVDASRLANHRREYLDFEGEIGGNRGTVQRVLSGTVSTTDDDSRRFTAEIQWLEGNEPRRAEIAFYLNLPIDRLGVEENCDGWRLRFSLGRYETN